MADDQIASTLDHITTTLDKLGISSLPSTTELGLYPESNPVDIYRVHIISKIQQITDAEPAIINAALQWTQTLDNGDLMLPVPALRLKGKKPDELAREIEAGFDSPLLEKVSAEKTFVRFFFKADALVQFVLPSVLKRRGQYGFNQRFGRENPQDLQSRKKRAIVEYSSPNIAKEFHTGHLRSTIIGGFLVKLYERAGWEVISMNYLGDWGKQYGVLSQGFDKYGSEEELQKDPIKHLNDVYVRINQDNHAEQKPLAELKNRVVEMKKQKEPPKPKKAAKGQPAPPPPEHTWTDEQEAELQETIKKMLETQEQLTQKPSIDEKARQFFKRMTDNDPEAIKNWQRFRDLSIDRYEGMYGRLNIHFDDYSGESQVAEDDMQAASRILSDKGISEESEGAVMVNFEKHKAPKLGTALVQKRDGTSLYLTRDIAANQERYIKYGFDEMLYVIADQQNTHVAQFFKILELMGGPYAEAAARCKHVTFGMVKAADGQTMSTRKGTVVSLADALDDIKDYMHSVMKKTPEKYDKVPNKDWTADVLGISSIMIQDFTGKRINGYAFNKEKMTSYEGDTGPYLQYAHARLCSIKREAAAKFNLASDGSELLDADFSLLLQSREAVELIRLLAQFPDVFNNTLKTLEPVTVLTYLFKLTHQVSSVYEAKDSREGKGNAKVMSVMYAETEEKRRAVLALYDAARQVLRNGMEVLGLTPVEAM